MSEFIAGFMELVPSAHLLGNIVGGIVLLGIPCGVIISLSCQADADFDEPDRP